MNSQLATAHPATDAELLSLNWEAHDYDQSLRILRHDQDLNSLACKGERVAAMVNSKSKVDLARRVDNLTEEIENDIVDALTYAEESLRMRLSLIGCALHKLMVADAVSNRGP